MHPAIQQLERNYVKPTTPQVQSGDTVRVHQKIREGNKSRIQVFEGVVIRTHRLGSASATITVRRIASGVGVEKTYLLHSPNVDKLEIMRRAKVRRNFLSYLRGRRGKSARLQEMAFDKKAANEGIPTAVAAAAGVVATSDDVNEPTKEELANVEEVTPVTDEELTELEVDETEDALTDDTISTEEIAKDENKKAAADEPKVTDDGTDQGDEDVARNKEFEEGVGRAQPNNQ